MEIRRVVTGNNAHGKAVFTSDGQTPRAHWYKNMPGAGVALVWQTPPGEVVPNAGKDITLAAPSFDPGPSGASMVIIQMPPDSVAKQPGFDPIAAFKENLALTPGVGDKMDPNEHGMHATDTVDMVVILEGEIVCIMDSGEEKLLRQHDVIIQNGTRHRWENRSDKPAKLCGVLLGCKRV